VICKIKRQRPVASHIFRGRGAQFRFLLCGCPFSLSLSLLLSKRTASPRLQHSEAMPVARPLLRALLRAESAWRKAARVAMERSAAAASSSSSSISTSSDLDDEPSTSSSTTLRFREPMDVSAWQRGRHGWALGGESYHLEAARAALGGGGGGSAALPLGPPTSGVFRGTGLRRLILSNFRAAAAAAATTDLSAAEDAGFAALRALGEQRAMERCSSDSLCANGVRVEATAALVAALPCSLSLSPSRASPAMRAVTAAGPGVIVITSVGEAGSSDEEEESGEDEDEDESDDDDVDDTSRRASRVASFPPPSPSSSPSSAASTAPEMRYVFTYRLRITNTNPPLPDDDEEDEEEEDGESDGGGEEGEEEATAAAETAKGTSSSHPSHSQTPGLRVQLLTRGWQIRDSSGRLHAAVPKGSPGVVGCTPVLSPGETFEYYSSTDLPTPAGVMSGSFGMTVVGNPGDGNGNGSESSSSSSSTGRSSGSGIGRNRKQQQQQRQRKSPSPSSPVLSTVAARRFEAVVAPFALRADPLKR